MTPIRRGTAGRLGLRRPDGAAARLAEARRQLQRDGYLTMDLSNPLPVIPAGTWLEFRRLS